MSFLCNKFIFYATMRENLGISMLSFPFVNEKNLNLTRVSEYVYSPIESLDEIIPLSQKLYTNPYYDYPYIYEHSDYDFGYLKNYVHNHFEKKEQIGVIQGENGIFLPKTNTAIRNTFNIISQEDFIIEYNKFFETKRASIEKFFNVSLLQATSPQILIYKEGCYYKRHSDNCSEILEEGKLVLFKPVAPARIITTVLFITSNKENPSNDFEFSGGELEFDFLLDGEDNVISIKPQEGDFVSFFSNPYYSHSVKEVTQGMRISIVQWHNAIVH